MSDKVVLDGDLSLSNVLDGQGGTVTLERADGRAIVRECIGAFPDMTPAPEPVEVEQGETDS